MKMGYEVIVVGVGAMGASTCYHLAKAGVRVLGLEQHDIPHSLGSSHGYSRMIRLAYYEKPDYVPLLRRAYDLWDELEAESAQKLLHRTGGLFMGPYDGGLLNGALKAAGVHRLPLELIIEDERQKRWPQFVLPENWGTLFDPEAGFLRPERVISTYAQLAMKSGAEIHGNEAVRRWKATDQRVEVETDRDTYTATHLIFTGGAWTGKLMADLGLPLKVTRQVMGWVWPRHNVEQFELGRLPVWAIDGLDHGGIFYGFPMIPDAPGMKLAHHCPTKNVVDPETVSRQPTPEDAQGFRPALSQYLPDANGHVVSMRVCLYTNTPDEDFILDHHPQHHNVHLACGFSGHGFKFASVIGEILAHRAMGQPEMPEATFLKLRPPFKAPADS
jgi:sarcosine oxidase